MIVTKRGYARAGFVGNPSDGYHGKTIAFTIGDYYAEVVLYESPELEFRPSPQDHAAFASMTELLENVRRNGYYGGIRLLKAAAKSFAEYCAGSGIELPRRNFTVRYSTTIPRQVGLGGSSAIITAAMRAMMEFFGVEIPNHVLPNVVLGVETEELGLTAGLQDRVVQAYGGLVYMDFDREHMEEHGHGRYEQLPAELLPPVYVAYRKDLGEESSKAHIHVRELYELGDEKVVGTLQAIADLADEARELMEAGDRDGLAEVLDRNFDLRAEIFQIRDDDLGMVRAARRSGASCKFCGSGGAVVGTFRDEGTLERLRAAMREGGYEFIVPQVAPNRAG
ncbi:MAG: mevalonate kinase family protein [Planctomycetota bacterium]|jgi:glucuronokinase